MMKLPANRMMLNFMMIFVVMSGCGTGNIENNSLDELLEKNKFQPTSMYTGPTSSKEKRILNDIVNDAIIYIQRLEEPRNPALVRNRLQGLLLQVDYFETADRDQTYIYAIQIWRAAGFSEESGLFDISDQDVLDSIE